MRPALDANGYLDEHSHSVALAFTVLDVDGTTQTFFLASYLESSLYAFGEDQLLRRLRSVIGRSEVERIGRRCAELELTSDPSVASGAGYAGDKALAMAAVEVLEGAPRPLARKRRRPRSPGVPTRGARDSEP
jgi:hypothetical protein